MKNIFLLTLLLLNGCAFDNMMNGLNSSLSTTNQALSGNLPNNKISVTSSNDIDCDKDSRKFKEWNSTGKNKIYSSNLKRHLETLDSKQAEMNKIQYKLIRYCNDRYASDSFTSDGVDINKPYIDKIRLEEAQQKINMGKK